MEPIVWKLIVYGVAVAATIVTGLWLGNDAINDLPSPPIVDYGLPFSETYVHWRSVIEEHYNYL
jgi:hypothetical protein